MSVNEKMTSIADKTRELLGVAGKMGLDAMSDNLGRAVDESDTQADIIRQLKGAVTENVTKTSAEVSTQSNLIQQIKAALDGKAVEGGGTVLPALTNPGSAEDLALGKQLIGADGKAVTGTVDEYTGNYYRDYTSIEFDDDWFVYSVVDTDVLLRKGTVISTGLPQDIFGNAFPENVLEGRTFTSHRGIKQEGTLKPGGGMVVKSGTTTSRTINTGLSDVEQFFLYKESVTGTGLIHLHYTKTATSRMYASAWSTQNYGTKTITNGTGGVTVSDGTVTISATQAAQGALSSNVTYKWIAVGTE